MLMNAVTARTLGRLSAANAAAARAKARTAFRMRRLYQTIPPACYNRVTREGPVSRAPGCHCHGRPGRPLRALSLPGAAGRRGGIRYPRPLLALAEIARARRGIWRAGALLRVRAYACH